MSFWNLSTGEQIKETTTFSSGGGDFEDIPNNTTAQAYIEEIKWMKGHNTEAEFINVRWRILAPKAYENRIVFQKMWVNGDNPEKKDREKQIKQGDTARLMLKAIDTNCGGGLRELKTIPQDQDLQANLLQKPMNIKIMRYEFETATGEKRTGNWISAVSPKAAVAEPVVQSKSMTTAQAINDSLPDDSEIPF